MSRRDGDHGDHRWNGGQTAVLIVFHRRRLGLSQAQLAARIRALSQRRTTRHTVKRWENGKRLPNPRSRACLAAVFGVDDGALARMVAIDRAHRAWMHAVANQRVAAGGRGGDSTESPTHRDPSGGRTMPQHRRA